MEQNKNIKEESLKVWNKILTNDRFIIQDNQEIKSLYNENINEIAEEISKYNIEEIEANETGKTRRYYKDCIKEIDHKLAKDKSFEAGFYFNKKCSLKEILDMEFRGIGCVTSYEFLYGASSAIVKGYLEDKIKEIEKSSSIEQTVNIKLKWKGNHNQLYDVLRQLKETTTPEGDSLLANSYEELAIFLKSNVICFKDTALSTIVKEIGKDKRPSKNRRIDLDITE